ncbi:hypothetical protein SAMN05446635_2273 [Burkholderia sp. OK233]|nr:hypothetical protein SAMN05446635_2273 [Burkholderia sp. OK233]
MFLPFRRGASCGVVLVFGFVCLFGAFRFCGSGLGAFPCFVSGLLALPLCGAAPTFLCMPQRKVGKRKRLKPLLLSGVRGLLRVVVHLESVFVHLHTPVTRASYFRRRCARRRAVRKTTRYVSTPAFHSETTVCHCISLSIGTATSVAAHALSLEVGVGCMTAEARRRGEADGPRRLEPKPLVSHADPSATHAVRSGS